MSRSPYTPPQHQAAQASPIDLIAANKVLRQTYMLLSITLIFSAVMAFISMQLNMGYMVYVGCSIAALVILWFVVPRTANSAYGLVSVFAFTGLLGFGLGPVLNHYLGLPNGGQHILAALGGMGGIFVGMSALGMVIKRDLSFMGKFLFAGLFVAFFSGIAAIVFDLTALMLAVNAAFLLISSLLILWQTNTIVKGGEDNYILATTTLYVSMYNIFIVLLQLIGLSDD